MSNLDHLTYERCIQICEENDDFIVRHETVNGYNVAQFNYRLASYEDFKQHDAFELRGLTFVQQDDGTWKRFLMLHKFFNLNQTIGYMYNDLKDKEIIRVQDKLDGSVIRFIKFPDGSVRAKSKFSFDSDQAMAAQKIYEENLDIRILVDDTLECDSAAIFELVGPFNRIVVNYHETDLRVLQVRQEDDGRYINVSDLIADAYNVRFAKPVQQHNLDELMKRCETEEGYEGFIVTFADGQMAKLKTKWYLQLHHLLTDALNRPDYVIQAVVDETIDDAMAQIPQDATELREYIKDIESKVRKYINTNSKDLYVRLFNDYYSKGGKKRSRKDFAIANKDHPLFSVMMKLWEVAPDEDVIHEHVKQWLLRITNKLADAERFIRK